LIRIILRREFHGPLGLEVLDTLLPELQRIVIEVKPNPPTPALEGSAAAGAFE
jgi:hypothetical protein